LVKRALNQEIISLLVFSGEGETISFFLVQWKSRFDGYW